MTFDFKKKDTLSSEVSHKILEHFDSMAKNCQEVLEAAFGEKIDFSESSLKLLDKGIALFHKDLFESDDSQEPIDEEQYNYFVCMFGSYLGEVIKRNMGGKWIPRSPYWDSTILISNKMELAPFNMIHKRFTEEFKKGSIYEKYRGLGVKLKFIKLNDEKEIKGRP